MPNTLAHLGAQTLATRSLLPASELRWIALGCVIPDLPWIIQRAAIFVLPWIDRYDLRLYAVAQASLAVSLLACASFACLASAPRHTFALLSLNAALHLLLDALQTKWANGVHLFAPLSWKTWNAELFWPESAATHTLTALGVAVFLWETRRWQQGPRSPKATAGATSAAPSRAGQRTAAACGAAYLLLPLALLSGPETTDSHSVRTLRNAGQRAGRQVEFDRVSLVRGPAGDHLVSFTGERLELVGASQIAAGVVSIRGTFRGAGALSIDAVHEHLGHSRDLPSYLGLAIAAGLWLAPLWQRINSRGRGSQPAPRQ